MKRIAVVLLGISISNLALAAQTVKTTRATFRNDGHVLMANGKTIFKNSSRKNVSANVQIVTAVGDLVAVTTETKTCARACHLVQNYKALDVNGKEVSLLALVDKEELLAALKSEEFLNGALADNAPEMLAKLHGARSVEEVVNMLFEGFTMGDFKYGLREPSLNSFGIYDYNAATNQMLVRIVMQQMDGADSWFGPEIELALMPSQGFAADLVSAKRQGKGLFMPRDPTN